MAESEETKQSTIGEELQHLIRISDSNIRHCLELEKKLTPPAVQEVVLARRHMEDANNRFKKAYNTLPEEER